MVQKQKGFVGIILAVILITIAGITGYFLVKNTTEVALAPENNEGTIKKDSLPDNNKPPVEYQIFQPGFAGQEIIDSVYLLKNDTFPQAVELAEVSFSVKKIEIEKQPKNGFRAYATIYYDNEEQLTGFWHPGDPTKSNYLKTNGCKTTAEAYNYSCGGLLSIRVEEWTRESTAEEQAQGIVGVYYQKMIFFHELDYDFPSNKWNYTKISLGLYEEKRYPIGPN